MVEINIITLEVRETEMIINEKIISIKMNSIKKIMMNGKLKCENLRIKN